MQALLESFVGQPHACALRLGSVASTSMSLRERDAGEMWCVESKTGSQGQVSSSIFSSLASYLMAAKRTKTTDLTSRDIVSEGRINLRYLGRQVRFQGRVTNLESRPKRPKFRYAVSSLSFS